MNAVTQQSARQLCCKLHAAPHLLLRYLTDAGASDCNSTDVQSQGVQLVIPDVQGTACMLDISRLVLILGREVAMSVACSAHLDALVTTKLSRAVCTISSIALVARTANSAPETAQSAQLQNNVYEHQLVLSNDLRLLSVVLCRVAVQLSRRIVVAACPQPLAKAIVSDLCLLSRSASMKASEGLVAMKNFLCSAAVSCLERFANATSATPFE